MSHLKFDLKPQLNKLRIKVSNTGKYNSNEFRQTILLAILILCLTHSLCT